MLFNSIEFLIFLPIVFALYLLSSKKLLIQNILLLVASYTFYGWWDYRFLLLILASTVVDFLIGIKIYKSSATLNKRLWLGVSLVFNLGLLGFFKYYNFFIQSFLQLLDGFGYQSQSIFTIKIILPVGISFYTFQTMSYSIDIYKDKLKPTNDFISFAAFVSFFPQLVAGPIERASNLLPQLLSKRKISINNFSAGLKLVIYGFFKKVVIADSLAPTVNDIFSNYTDYSGGTLILGAILFAFQIYGDFSGYSDIAIGIARIFGFNLMTNFNYPYFSKTISDFWRRWHISLSTWFRDYLYIPLGGSKVSKGNAIRNVFIIFLVSGFWHGANWTFLVWGAIHALIFIPDFLWRKTSTQRTKVAYQQYIFTGFQDFGKIILTFMLVTFAWVFFRAENLSIAIEYISRMSNFTNENITQVLYTDIFLVLIFVFLEYLKYKNYRIPYYCWILIIASIIGGLQQVKSTEFIYFQF